METAQVIQKIQAGLQACHNESKISQCNMSIKISLKKGFVMDSVVVKLNDGEIEVKPIKVSMLFGINRAEEVYVAGKLGNALKYFSAIDRIPDNVLNARIYSNTNDFYPSIAIYNGAIKVRETDMNELTKALN